jgi:very-short-patch-repair endonuclease
MGTQSPDFESIKRTNPYQAEYWSARDLAPLLGYSNWQNFDRLVQRAQNLISTGAASGAIAEAKKKVIIGSGATRQILDYYLDNAAVNLVKELASSYKLTKHFSIRNETVLLALLKKYCSLKGLGFQFQQAYGDYVFDCVIDGYIAVEFDEPYHMDRRGRSRDIRKEAYAVSLGLKVIRFDLSDDIVDMIVEVERHLSNTAISTWSTFLAA